MERRASGFDSVSAIPRARSGVIYKVEQQNDLMKQYQTSHKLKRGFSLVELLVVIAIIGVLMALMVGISGAVVGGAEESEAKAQMADLMNEIEKYNSDEGGYPATWAEFGTWYDSRYAGTAYTITEGEPEAPIDPWGNNYEYRFDTNKPFVFFIGSRGPNGANDDGGLDDITNRNGALN